MEKAQESNFKKILDTLCFVAKTQREHPEDSSSYEATQWLGKIGISLIKDIPEEEIEGMVPSKFKIEETLEEVEETKVDKETEAEDDADTNVNTEDDAE